MTVAVQTPTISYVEDGSSTVFAVPFRYDAPADLRAVRIALDGTETALINGTDFTATPGPTNAGGTLTVAAAASTGTRLFISRETVRAQSADYISNGAFTAESHERALDQAMMVNQEQDQKIARAVQVARGEAGLTLPAAAARAGKFLGFDLDGNPVAAEGTASGDAAMTAFVADFDGAVPRTAQDKLRETVSVLDFGAVGDGVADDTAAIQAALDSGLNVIVPKTDAFYKVAATLLQTEPGQVFTNNGTIKLVVTDGLKRPLLVVSQAAVASVRNGTGTFDHNSAQWPTAATFDPEALGGNTSDAPGIAMLIMADQSSDSDYTVKDGWDSGLGIGNFSLIDGAQSAGPDGSRVHNVKTINCGSGKHNWGPAPGGFYYQGVGVGVLTATNFNVTGCTDFGSYGSFWADINGGGHGVFANCISIEAKQGPIWSDAANGSNQIWYTNGVFGGNLTGAGAGWRKTPGGVAFMSGTYGVSFVNCTAFEPAWIGFALDQWSSKCVLTNCRVVKSGGPGVIDAGQQNEFSNIDLEDCCRQVGTVSASGSTCPALGAFETMGSSVGLVRPQIVNLNVGPERVYPGTSPAAVKYSYALWARRSASSEASRISVIGGRLTNGVIGRALADTSCEISVMSSNGAELRYEVFGGAATKLAFEQDGVRGLSIDQTTDDMIVITSEVAGKNLIIGQSGNGTIQAWVNGSKRVEITATNIFFNSLPTSSPGVSGAVWRDAGAGNVLKAVP